MEIKRLNWPATPSDNAADYPYSIVRDGEQVGLVWQDEFNGPWLAENNGGKRGEFKTRKAAVASLEQE